MSDFLTAYTTAIQTRINTLTATPGPLAGVIVLLEDAADLETQVTRAIDEFGMLILIGEATCRNTRATLRGPAAFTITSGILLGETPTVWRDTPLTKPVCRDVAAQLVNLLQGFDIAGFTPLIVESVVFVPDKRRQLYEINLESKVTIQKTT